MRIIPVIDILNGRVVHAVRGKRKEYQPLKSILCNSSDPLAVALAFKVCGFKELYVADLDAILEQGENSAVLREIVEKTSLMLMFDAGVDNLEKAQHLLRNKVSKIIIGTETLQNLRFVQESVERFGSDRVIVSLDLMNGKVLCKSEEAKLMSPLALAHDLEKMGVTEMIVLDLARVGSGEGVDFELLKEIMRRLKTKVLVGGGARDIKDLMELQKIGLAGVLLATALHSGRISLEELRKAGLITS